jgi:hypothetical protein
VHHRLTEKYHALFFHLDRFGRDPIGTADFREYTQIVKHGASLFPGVQARVEQPIVQFMRDAYRGAYGDAPDGETWAGWVRSFRHFGLLVALPIAKRNSDKKQRDPSLRPRYFENELFRFWDFYACSERRVTELCNLGYDYFDAGDFSPAARDAFLRAARIDDLAEPGLVYPELLAALPPLPRLSVRCTPGITAPPGNEPWRKRDRRRELRQKRRAARVRRLGCSRLFFRRDDAAGDALPGVEAVERQRLVPRRRGLQRHRLVGRRHHAQLDGRRLVGADVERSVRQKGGAEAGRARRGDEPDDRDAAAELLQPRAALCAARRSEALAVADGAFARTATIAAHEQPAAPAGGELATNAAAGTDGKPGNPVGGVHASITEHSRCQPRRRASATSLNGSGYRSSFRRNSGSACTPRA